MLVRDWKTRTLNCFMFSSHYLPIDILCSCAFNLSVELICWCFATNHHSPYHFEKEPACLSGFR